MNTFATNEPGCASAIRDDILQQTITQSLARKGADSLRQVQVDVRAGLATLRGSVGRYYDKQLAQEIVKRIDGIERLQNEIVVE